MRACSASVRCGLQPLCLQRYMHFTAAVQATHLLNDLDNHLCQEPGHWVRMKQAIVFCKLCLVQQLWEHLRCS